MAIKLGNFKNVSTYMYMSCTGKLQDNEGVVRAGVRGQTISVVMIILWCYDLLTPSTCTYYMLIINLLQRQQDTTQYSNSDAYVCYPTLQLPSATWLTSMSRVCLPRLPSLENLQDRLYTTGRKEGRMSCSTALCSDFPADLCNLV